jgi:hypothetical protein
MKTRAIERLHRLAVALSITAAICLTGCHLVSGVSPNPAEQGTNVTLAGYGFGASQGSSTVLLDGTPLTVVSWSSTQIVVTLPSVKPEGTYSLTVVVAGQSASLPFEIDNAPEGAISDFEVVTAETAVDTASPKAVQATCPIGTLLLSGGAEFIAPQPGLMLNAAGPNGAPGSPDSFMAAGYDASGAAGAWGLRSIALCGNAIGYTAGTANWALGPYGGVATHFACPADRFAIGGGIQIAGATTDVVIGLSSPGAYPGPLPNDWGVSASSRVASPGAWGFRWDIVCATELPGLALIEAESALDLAATKSATATCPSGTRAVGGGAEIRTGSSSAPNGFGLTGTAPTGPSGAPDGWVASAEALAPISEAWVVQTRVVCAAID